MLAPIRNITIHLIFCEYAYILEVVVYNEGMLFDNIIFFGGLFMEWIKLIGILVIVVGFVLKLDTISTVIIAGIATAIVSGIGFGEFLELLGSAFVNQRFVSIFYLSIPIIGIAESYGLKIKAVEFIERFKNLTMGLFYSVYLVFRLIAGMLSIRIGGHASFVRPIVQPMGDAAINASIADSDDKASDAAQEQLLSDTEDDAVKGLAAANENFGNFFGQNMFAGSAGVLMMAGTLAELGYESNPAGLALASIPAGILCALIGTAYNFYVDRKIRGRHKKEGN